MNKLILTATGVLLSVVGLHAAGADPQPGFTVYETCHQYIAVNDDSGERLNIRKVSMHDELDRQLPYSACVEEIVFTGPPTRNLVCPSSQTESASDGESAQTYRIQRPVVIRVGGAVDREISGVMVYRESDGIPSVRRPCPPGPRH